MNAVLACRGNLTAPRTVLWFGAALTAVSLPESGKPSFAEGSNWPGAAREVTVAQWQVPVTLPSLTYTGTR